MDTFTRPGRHTNVATPEDETLISIFGGRSFESVTFTTDQNRDLERFYGMDRGVA